jgi:hypothetical protein
VNQAARKAEGKKMKTLHFKMNEIVDTGGSGYTPPGPGTVEHANKPAFEPNPREAKPDANPSPESYTDAGKLTSDKWKEKVGKFNKSVGKEPKKPAKAADQTPPPASGAVSEAAPAQNTEEPQTPVVEEAAKLDSEGNPIEETAAPAQEPEKFKVNTKFSVMGKEYEFPKFMAEAVSSPEQEKELRDVFTRAMAFDHTKQRNQELQDKFKTLETDHGELVDGVEDLSNIYQEAVKSGNPLLLNHFFENLKIPHQVILQYAQALAQFYESDPSQQQTTMAALEAHRRAREMGKQNARLTQGNFQGQVQARTMELETVLARPEISSSVQQFEQKFGPGSFKQELIRNGVYVFQTERRDLSIAENMNQVLTRFGITAAQATGNPATAAPQVPAANPAPAAAASSAPAPSGGKPVIPAQPHRQVPTIPAVNGKSGMSPTKQAPKNIQDIKNMRKQKYGF